MGNDYTYIQFVVQAEIRKREEKEAAEALKREQELREAKRQQQRLNFLLSQTELYGHFMQNKSSAQPGEALLENDKTNDQEAIMSSSDAIAIEEDPEEAQMKMEALKAAQDAVSKQKKITSAFDDECLKFRQASGVEVPEQDNSSVAGSSNIDLLHPYVFLLPVFSVYRSVNELNEHDWSMFAFVGLTITEQITELEQFKNQVFVFVR